PSLRKTLLVLAALAALASPSPAYAHVRTGAVAVDYRVRVFPTRLPLSAHVYLGDRALRLSVRPGHSVTVLGYGGEPFLRIDAAGVSVLRSPTAAALRLTPGHRSGRSFLWHDARGRGLPSGSDRGGWTIPLLGGGRRRAARPRGRRPRLARRAGHRGGSPGPARARRRADEASGLPARRRALRASGYACARRGRADGVDRRRGDGAGPGPLRRDLGLTWPDIVPSQRQRYHLTIRKGGG